MSRMLSEALVANYALFAALPQAARDEMRATLAMIARDVQKAQQAIAPVYAGKTRKGVTPGLLKGALTVAEALENLRVRVGLPQLKGRKSKLFYAIIMEYGRKAQEVPLRRLKQGARSEWRQRIRAGSARSSLKPDDLLSSMRTLRVTALAPRPFVHLEAQFEAVIDRHLASFWAHVTDNAAA